MTVYLIWCLSEEEIWEVHSVCGGQEAAEEKAMELEDDYDIQCTITSTKVQCP